jgi:hypothetical protein
MWIIEDQMAICLICRDSLPIQDESRDDYTEAMESHVASHDKKGDWEIEG